MWSRHGQGEGGQQGEDERRGDDRRSVRVPADPAKKQQPREGGRPPVAAWTVAQAAILLRERRGVVPVAACSHVSVRILSSDYSKVNLRGRLDGWGVRRGQKFKTLILGIDEMASKLLHIKSPPLVKKKQNTFAMQC